MPQGATRFRRDLVTEITGCMPASIGEDDLLYSEAIVWFVTFVNVLRLDKLKLFRCNLCNLEVNHNISFI